MHEEVGLQEDQVQLVRSGRPLFVDSGRLHFTVHPFLFHLTDPEARVRLNWENVDHAWVQPAGIRSLDTVPLLAETYMRVEVLPLLRPHLDRLQRDREHGAVQLACWVLDALQELGKQLRGQEGGDLPGEGREALQVLLNQGYHLGEVRPSMAPLVNVAAAVLGAVRAELAGSAGAAPSLQEVWREVGKAIQQERDALRQSSRSVRAAVLELLREGMTVMTTSYSSTVEDALREGSARGLRLSAIVCEARPLCEGVQLANSLAGAGVGTTLITDAQAAVFMEQANLVLVGADTLTQRHVINKAGTHLLALAAAARGVPLYVAASSCKLSPGPLHDVAHAGGQEGAAPSLEEAEAGEVVASWQSLLDSRVTVRNVYFEATPLELVTGIVTEEGLLEPAQAVQQIEELKQLYIDAFQLSPLV